MEHRLLSHCRSSLSLCDVQKSASSAISLITNPFTSHPTLSSLYESLTIQLQIPDSNKTHHCQILSLLAAFSHHHSQFASVVHESILLPSVSIPSRPYVLSLVLDSVPSDTTQPDPFSDESLFLSLCFCQCLKTRNWVVKNVGLFQVRSSVLLTVLLGISKDPYPYVREAALDGIVLLSRRIFVDDHSILEGCYFCATELLFDSENSVRCSAVRAVSELGQLLLVLKPDKCKREWSDPLFVQLSLMARDMDMKVRVSAFDALGKIQGVSKDILLQTLSKKVLESTKEKSYPGHYTSNLLKIPVSATAFTFLHGLQDEFYEVRRSACQALQMLTFLSSEFAGEAVHVVMDLLNDDSLVVRQQALETLHFITLHNHLEVEESHLHMFLYTLMDGNPMIRYASRKAIQSTKLPKLMMFRSCIDVLVKSLEMFPKDEAEIFSCLYKIGRAHGKFVAIIIHDTFQESDPSLNGNLNFHSMRTVALLVLAVSAPVSFDKEICSILPKVFSCAATLLGRISSGLVDLVDQHTLLAYLAHCSRLTFVSASEFFKGEVPESQLMDSDVHVWEKSDGIFDGCKELKKITAHGGNHLNSNNVMPSYAEVIFQQVMDLWPFIQIGCMDELRPTLRSWKYELKRFSHNSSQSAGDLAFASNYLTVIKFYGKVWAYDMFPGNLLCNGVEVLEVLFVKTERILNEMLYRYIGLTRDTELYVLELILVTSMLRLSFGMACCFDSCICKLKSIISSVESIDKEGSVELSVFVIELRNALCKCRNTEDVSCEKLSLLQKSLEHFTPKHFLLPGELKYMKAELDILDNDFQNPLPFISGLPVGISLEINLYNIPGETRSWLIMTLTEKSTQFVFLDLHEFGGCDEVRKFSFVAPFYATPNVKYFSIKVSIAMECQSDVQLFKHNNGPKHELVRLCKDIIVHLSVAPVK